MKNNETKIVVKNQSVRVLHINSADYISLTDLARYANQVEPKIPIYTWIRNKDVISFLGLWEQLNNNEFKGHEFETFETKAGKNNFYISPQNWIKSTNAIGIISKSGNRGGTYAHSQIAFEFASWLSPEFKLYLITEFERLKKKETLERNKEWEVSRILSKKNYILHTDAVKNYIVPALTNKQIKYIYAEEADLINVALFGMTAKEWRINNPSLSKEGNIRDFVDTIHLIFLSNLEAINSELIRKNISQSERLVTLNEIARNQMNTFINNRLKINEKNQLLSK